MTSRCARPTFVRQPHQSGRYLPHLGSHIQRHRTQCCGSGEVQALRRFGVLLQDAIHGSQGGGGFALVAEYSSETNLLDTKVYAGLCTDTAWAALAYAMTTEMAMAVEYPGQRSRASIAYPEHGKNIRIASTVRLGNGLAAVMSNGFIR